MKYGTSLIAAAAALTMLPSAVSAQRDPAYAAARAAGSIGE